MSDPVFEQPPNMSRRNTSRRDVPRVDHAAVAAELRARPGQWAKVQHYITRKNALTVAWKIRHGAYPDSNSRYAPPGAYDATVADIDGEHWLYIRYTGTPAEGGEAR